MANKYIKSRVNNFSKLARQKALIEKNYTYLKCKIIQGKLTCKGTLQPNDACKEYTIKLTYEVGTQPKVKILEPQIEYNDEIHLYKSGNLCLFHSSDLVWNDDKVIIAKTIIPWISEWIIFYEIWQITGKWLGKEIKHTPKEDE